MEFAVLRAGAKLPLLLLPPASFSVAKDFKKLSSTRNIFRRRRLRQHCALRQLYQKKKTQAEQIFRLFSKAGKFGCLLRLFKFSEHYNLIDQTLFGGNGRS